MEEDHEDDYEPSDFLKQNRDLLRGFSFKFEGLTPHHEKLFKNAVQDLGALVSDDAKYILADKSYFKLDINKNRTDLYNICYILDSITAKRPLDIELYRHNKNKIPTESTKSSKKDDIVNSSGVSNDIFTEKSKNIYISKEPCTSTNNLENAKKTKHVSKKVPAKIEEGDELMDVDIAKKTDIGENEEITDSLIINNEKNYRQSNEIIIQQEVQNKINSNTSNKIDNEISNSNKLPNPLNKINKKKLAFQTINSKTVESVNDVINKRKIKIAESVKIAEINKRTNVEDTFENLSDDKKTFSHDKNWISKKCVNQLSAMENHRSIDKNKIDSIPDDKSSLDNTQVSENDSQINRDDTRSDEKRYNRIKQKLIDSSSTDDDLTDDSTTPSTSKNIKNNKDKNHQKKVSGWIDPKSFDNVSCRKVYNNSKKEKVDHDTSDSDVVYDSDEENRKLNNRKYWWLEQDIPDSEACSTAGCSFEPDRHRTHAYARRMLSDDEKKIILKYLIMNECIKNAKGAKVWNQMLADGYLTHRSAETLRNCFRRSILSNITSFGLTTELLDQFLEMEERKY